jgi:hypothetical protein
VLNKGLNLISLPLILADNSIDFIFGPELSKVKSIYEYNPISGWRVYNSDSRIPSSLTSIKNRRSYFIIMNNLTLITINGNITYPN